MRRISSMNRILAILLTIMMIVALVPVNVFALEHISSVLSSDISEKTFVINQPTEFSFTTIANDDARKMVVGSFVFSDPGAIEKLEYLETQDGNWYELNGDFGPSTGFPMADATSSFRVTFNKAGNYTATVSMKTVEDGTVLCSVTEDIVVTKIASTIVTDIEEKTFNVGDATEFTFSTTANDYKNERVIGTFEFSDPDAIEKLEYLETQDGNWYELNGDFGPSTGFPMSDATSRFRATFNKAGNYTVTVSMKTVSDGAIVCSTTADVKVEHKVSVSVLSNIGGSITVNDNKVNNIEIYAGTDVEVNVEADTGYWIDSVIINGKVQSVTSGSTKFTATISSINSDTEISVSFVKVYIATVTHSGTGTGVSNPENGGSVTVENGKVIEITATPDEGNRVLSVTVNGQDDKTVTGTNDTGYFKELNADKDYEIVITFASNVYKVSADTPVNGSVEISAESVEYNGNATVYLIPDEGYTVDTVKVNDKAINEIKKDDNGIYFEIENIKDDKKITVSYKETSMAEQSEVSVDSKDALRVNSNGSLYVIKKGTSITLSTEKSGIRIYDANGIVAGNESTQSVTIESSLTITKVELYYPAEGEYYSDWHTVEMPEVKIVVDDGENIIATLTPQKEANVNGYYNSDVVYKVVAEDTGDYSGIALVEYWITYNGAEGRVTTLYKHENGNDILNKYEDSEGIVIDASVYNSDNIIVALRVVDRAGNEKIIEEKIKINSTKPSVALSIDGTQNANAQKGYYNDKRTLTITIVDREDTFSKVNAAEGLVITNNGTPVEVETSDVTWKHTSGSNQYDGTYVFSDDGHYEWSYSYENLAGLSPEENSVTGNDIYDFYVDKAAPYNLKVIYSPKFIDVFLEALTFGFYDAPVSVTIEATDETAGVEQFVYFSTTDEVVSSVNTGISKTIVESNEITYDGNRAYTTFEIPAQFRGKVSFSATDKAGRTTELTDGRTVVVDTIAPGVTVEFDNHDVYNGEYYNADRTATIKITEANFFADDIKDGKLVVKRTKRLNDGTFTEENLSPEFTKNGDVYTATVLFDEDADYTFDITYTDRAGNVYDSYPMDEFTIDKINPVIEVSFDNNEALHDNQFNKKRTATIKVTEHNFDKNGISATVDEVACELKWEQVEGENDVHVAEITFPGDADYTFAVDGIDKAGNANDGVDTGDSIAPWAFTVDNSGPTGLTVTYEPTFVGTLLENLTFGFYKAPVKVTIEATDETAGIDYFAYTYSVQDGASGINIGKENVKVDVDGTTASTTFEIPAQFRGCVSFVATNNSGVSTKYSDDRVVVVDTISPSTTVEYENNNALNDKYYDADRTATIKINEANFFAKDIEDGLLVITRTTTLNNGEYKEEILDLEFSKDGDVYTATVDFKKDADYTFGIKYTDRSGNIGYSATIDEFTVDKIQPEISIEQADGAYFDADRTAKITVVEHNFRASDFEFTASACDVTGKTDIDLSSKNYNAYLKDQTNWTQVVADTWEAELTFDIEGNYTIGATYSDLAGNPQVEEIKDTFCVDKTDPENLTITYEPTFVGVILNALTFGFYDAPVKVRVEATDNIAGIDYFVYSYNVESGASKVNIGKSNIKVNATPIEGTGTAYAEFEISEQFRGHVSFDVYDRATNNSVEYDDTVIIVDNIAPGISVSYDNYSAEYDSYYRADRTATIVIEEANFFGNGEWDYADVENGNLVITVEKILNDGTKTTEIMKPDFVKDGDVYTGTVSFAENADYNFDISYTDRSGNKYDLYEIDKFTVDTIKPVIRVSYNDEEAKYSNDNQFRTNREATITIIEHNFKASDVVATVTANGKDVEYYAEYLAEDSNWKHNGDVHTAVIEYSNEAHYTFDISYTDMAGNMNAPVEYGSSVSPTVFTVDKSAPVDLDIQINGESVVGSMNSIEFDKFYGKAVTVKLSATCDISGLDSLKFQKVANASEYREDAVWSDYNDETGIVVNPSEKLIIYFRAEDRAGNVSIIRSTGIIVDDQKPVGELNAPEIDIIPKAPNVNGIHKDNVTVDLKVVDPKYSESIAIADGHYSGLNNITYKIYASDIDTVEEGTLFDSVSMTEGAVFDSDDLVTAWSGKITIDAEKFNSNNVIVEIVATDNSGNTRTTTTTAGEIKIDITAPTIVVSYDNNNADSGSFFKADRTATIKITERNFNSEDIVVTIKNTDGVIPEISEFTKATGTENEDDTVWTANIKYSSDGDYSFDIEYTDLAENTCSGEMFVDGTVASNNFTIDKTLPVIEVSYDNNDVQNSNYYKTDRTATVVITEHNFNAERVTITNTASDDGTATTLPTVSGWTSKGDKHTATVHYGNDAKYTFDVAMSDKAGNASADYTEETFFVDTTMPTLEITGVADKSANNGDVIPVVSYSDTNYDAEQVTITLTGANRSDVALDGYYTDIHNGRTFTFNNFAKEKDIDDIYTLSASLTDKAGNTTEKSIVFSVNRFGSTYAMSDDLFKLNGTFVQKPIDVVITETNANELNNIKITLFKNNETIILTEGKDYKISMTGGNGEWYHYTYTVFAKNFAEDGVYRLAFHSEDASGNVAENTLDTKDAVVSFGIDSTKPNIMVANLENGVTYALENLTVKMSVSDNLMLSTVNVYLDDYNTPYATWTAEEIESILADSGELSFDISGDSTNAHKVKIICIDAAGNVQEEEITNFFVTTNIWVRYYTNKALFFGSIGGVVFLAGLIIFLVVWKKKRNEK